VRRHGNASRTEVSPRFKGDGERLPRTFVALLCALGALAFVASPARAGTGVSHPHLLSIQNGSEFRPSSLAIGESSGRLYALSREDGVVDVFDATTGAFIAQWTGEETPEGSFFKHGPQVIAVDNSGGPGDGTVYVATCGRKTGTTNQCDEHGYVHAFDPSGNYLRTIDGSESPSGAFTNGSGGLSPWGLAADGGGNLYAIRLDTKSIEKFSPTGTFLGEIKKPQANFPRTMAFDSSNGYYISNFCRADIVAFDSAGIFQSALGVAEGPGSVAVDTVTDDVYIAGSNFLSQFDSSGALVGHFGSANFLGTPNCGAQPDIAVNGSTSQLYAIDRETNTVSIFGPGEPATTPDVTIEPATEVGFYTATLHGTVDPNGEPTSYRFQYDGDTESQHIHSFTPVESAGSGTEPVVVSAEVPLTDPLFHSGEFTYRLIATNTDADVTEVTERESFTTETPPPPPIDPPTEVTSTSAQVSGSVNPQGLETEWSFNIGGLSGNAGSGTKDVPVSGGLTDLEPNTTYTLTLTAKNKGGSVTSAPVEFTTDPEEPVAATVPAGCLKPTSACLGATIDPRKSPTSYYFEYGTDTEYGSFLPLGKDGDAGAALGFSSFTEQLEELEPETVYHYRLVAENQAGPTVTPDAVFETRSQADVEAGWPRRGFELVTPPDKGNQSVLPGRGTASVGAAGERVVWQTLAGAPGSTTGSRVPFIASRGGDGLWSSRAVVPAADEQPGGGQWNFVLTDAATDLTSFLLQPSSSFVGSSAPGMLLRADDSAGLVQLGPTGERSLINAFELLTSADLRKAVFVDPDGSGGLVEYSEDGSRLIDMPDCGFQFPQQKAGARIYRWLTSQGATAFVESAGDGPCDLPKGVFRIDLESGDAELISGPQTVAARFGRASADGNTAIYTRSGEIYRWEEGEGSTCLTCATGGTGVVAWPLLITSDLERIYFQSPKQLIAGKGVAGLPCGASSTASCNMYAWHGGEIEFVSVMGNLDGGRGAETHDGSVLLYFSKDERTTADVTGTSAQLYRYEAETGKVECVSCTRIGTATDGSPTVEGSQATGTGLSADGRTVAFATTASLVHRDVNNTRDVYEWHDGLLRLVTDGVTEIADESVGYPEVWGLSDDGRNLIFGQRGRLVGNEADSLTNVYNARVGGGTVLEEPPAPCVEDSCQGPLEAPPALASPGSAAFSGPGNAQVRKKRANERRRAKRKQAKQRRAKQRRRKARQRRRGVKKRSHRRAARRANHNRGGGK